MLEKRLVEIILALVFLVLVFALDRKKVLYLIVLVLPVSFNSRFGEINIYLVLLLYTVLFLKDLGKSRHGQRSKIIPLFFSLFVFSYLISLLYNFSSLDFPDGLLQSPYYKSIVTLFSCMALFSMVTKYIDTIEDVQNVIKFFIAAYLICSVASILQIINPSKLYFFEYFTHYQSRAEQEARGGIRVYGTIGEYELYAEYSAIVLLLLFYSLLEMSQMAWKKVIYGALAVLTLFLLFMAKTRGPLVAISLVLAYLTLIKGRKIGIGRNLIFGCVIASIVFIVYAVISAQSEYNVIDHLVGTEVDVGKGSFDTRSATWRYGLDYFLHQDFLHKIMGLGPGIVSRTDQLATYPHSLYFYLLLSLGIIGFVIYIAWFVWLFIGKAHKPDRSVLTLSIFLKAVLLLFVIDELKIEFLRVSSYQQIIWVIFGLLYVVNKRILPASNETEDPVQKTGSVLNKA